ncbi:VOC family protein [Pseudonocardia phyllosphaerae]|uniref:VOC family protein n=1 Tax=Pseudonocardia phyllosphaerae TaxID=3390502 RepID=UPI0039792806
MDLHIGSVVVGADDVARAVRFWCAALGYRPRDEPQHDWAVLTCDEAGRPNVSIMLTEARPQPLPRLHLDLYATDQAAEVERLLGLGAVRVDWPRYPENPDFVVLADTEGNLFCVIDTTF